jgi:hypothetical protein
VAGCCEHGNELLGLRRILFFFWLAEELVASQEGWRCAEFQYVHANLGVVV